MSTEKDTFESITTEQLDSVAGGKSANAEVTAMLTSIGDSIKELANTKNNSGGGDMMQMMLMMLMMGGGGGGGGGVVAAPGQPPVINVSTGVSGGGFGCGRKKGKKGW